MPDDWVTIVSGLPRSGTSLMMQMLQAGGMKLLTDERRAADQNNPRGYFEYEAVKRSGTDVSWLGLAGGRVVKVIHLLLRHLPADRPYRVIFMQRPLPEVLRSQDEMLRRRGNAESNIDTSAIGEAFQRHLIEINQWLAGKFNMEVSRVHYHRVLREPKPVSEELAAFLKTGLDIAAMVQQVDGSLYRNRMK